MDMRSKILKILCDVMEIEDIDLEDCLKYELDSLTFMQFIVTLEEEFDLEMPDDLLFYDGKETFEKIINFLQERDEKLGSKLPNGIGMPVEAGKEYKNEG